MSALVAPQKEQTRSEQMLTELPAVLGCRLYVRVARPPALPWCSVGRESACSAGDLGSIPGLGRSPRGGHGNPLPVFLPGESPWTEEPGGLQSKGRGVRHDQQLKRSSAQPCRLLVEKTRPTAVSLGGLWGSQVLRPLTACETTRGSSPLRLAPRGRRSVLSYPEPSDTPARFGRGLRVLVAS